MHLVYVPYECRLNSIPCFGYFSRRVASLVQLALRYNNKYAVHCTAWNFSSINKNDHKFVDIALFVRVFSTFELEKSSESKNRWEYIYREGGASRSRSFWLETYMYTCKDRILSYLHFSVVKMRGCRNAWRIEEPMLKSKGRTWLVGGCWEAGKPTLAMVPASCYRETMRKKRRMRKARSKRVKTIRARER